MQKSEEKTKRAILNTQNFLSLDNSLKGSPNDWGTTSIKTNRKYTCTIK
jgi:hypothetical protein